MTQLIQAFFSQLHKFRSQLYFEVTVKRLLSGPPVKGTPSIKRTLGRVPKLTSYISLYNELLFSAHLYQADADTKNKLYLANFYY